MSSFAVGDCTGGKPVILLSYMGTQKQLFSLFFLSVCFVAAQATDSLAINRLTIRQGLSNNSVRAIFQDHNGFMWFGTYDGLNRYDGYSFKTFRNKIHDTASLPHNYINAIGEDRQGNLFVGTGQGLSIYNDLTSTFSTGLYIPFSGKQKERIPFNVNIVKTDATGNVYLGTTGGGVLLKQHRSAVAIQLACAKGIDGTCKNDVQSIVIDKSQSVWLSIADAGLFLYNRATQQLQLVNNQSLVVRCMEADEAGNLWIGAYDGLYKYNIAAHTLVHLYNQPSGKLTANSIFSLAFDQQHQLWIGTEGGGINILNTTTNALQYLLPGDGKNNLSSETVYVIYKDKESRKWIGTHKGGINIIDPHKSVFQSIVRDPLNPNSLTGNFISSFYNDQIGNLWIGSDGGGVSIWNREKNSFTNYHHVSGNPQSLSNNAVPSIVEDYLGNIWMATYGDGVNKFNKATQTFEHYKCINDQTGEENNYVWRLYEDREQNLWATTYSNGRLYILNRQTNRFDLFSPDFIDLFCLMEDQNGILWGGTAFGLCKIDKQEKKFQYYPITKPVRSIFEDKKKQLWLGTEGLGLILFNRTKGQVAASYNDSNGLCNNSVLNILSDDKGNLWLSTFHGLSRFEPVSKKFSNFYQEDGLQSNQFEYNAGLQLRSGEMAFGGVGGFTLFHPDSLQVHSTVPPLFLTGLRVNNQPVNTSSDYVTQTNRNGIQKLVIPYNDAVLAFDFTALEYSLPDKIGYAYYLEGWDKGWNHVGALRTANYTRLKEGTYHFHVKCTDAAGNWNPTEVTLEVVILPPWYRSWWAYFLYAGMVALLIYLYNAYRVRQARLQYEVKLAHINAEKEKELAEKKLTFFTDVSHEFRTPLMLIINPLKDFMQNDKEQDKRELNVVYRNARRLLTLVDQLLQFRKAGADADTLRIVKLNFSELCRDIYASFKNGAASKHLDYQFSTTNEALELYVDREKMEIILYNLLSNAIKFTPDGGEISIRLIEKENTVEVKLSDNGQGIPPTVGNKLFERFYQVQETKAPAKPGFGIGLYLVKHFVEKHKGAITYDSTPGIGTTFCLSFQKGRDHFAELPVYEETPEKLPLGEALSPAPVTTELDKNGLEELVSSQKSILIVEDNDPIREYVSNIFKDSFTVYEASGGHQGIQLAQNYLPDIIISDIMMDQGNGIELCSTIKNDPSLGHIPVILLTAVADTDIKLKGTESGADDYITKPFEKELLVARVTALLKNRTKLQQYFYNEVTLRKQDFKITAEYKVFLDTCITIVERHLDDDNFNIKKLSQEIGMSHSALYRKVKSVSGQSIAGFIRFIRLRKAAELMIKTTSNVNEIAFEVGMSDVKYFRKQFNALFGMNPSEYIKKFRPPFTPTLTLHVKPTTGKE